jgi:hypothetical protein
LIFCPPNTNEYRIISGVAAETKLSLFIPKFFKYHSVLFETDFTVKTRWSRDITVAAGVDIFLAVTKFGFSNWQDLRNGCVCLFKANI